MQHNLKYTTLLLLTVFFTIHLSAEKPVSNLSERLVMPETKTEVQEKYSIHPSSDKNDLTGIDKKIKSANSVQDINTSQRTTLSEEQIKRQIVRLEDLLERNSSNPDFDKDRVERRIKQLNEKLENSTN